MPKFDHGRYEKTFPPTTSFWSQSTKTTIGPWSSSTSASKKSNTWTRWGATTKTASPSCEKYLAEAFRDKKGTILNTAEWQLRHARNLPRQENGSDCGVFALKYADYTVKDAALDFRQADMPYFRRRMMVEILRSTLILSADPTHEVR